MPNRFTRPPTPKRDGDKMKDYLRDLRSKREENGKNHPDIMKQDIDKLL